MRRPPSTAAHPETGARQCLAPTKRHKDPPQGDACVARHPQPCILKQGEAVPRPYEETEGGFEIRPYEETPRRRAAISSLRFPAPGPPSSSRGPAARLPGTSPG